MLACAQWHGIGAGYELHAQTAIFGLFPWGASYFHFILRFCMHRHGPNWHTFESLPQPRVQHHQHGTVVGAFAFLPAA